MQEGRNMSKPDKFTARFIKLSKGTTCQKVCKEVEALLKDYFGGDTNMEDNILTIEIRTISHTDNDLIKKLDSKK